MLDADAGTAGDRDDVDGYSRTGSQSAALTDSLILRWRTLDADACRNLITVDTVTITITVKDVNEAPSITGGPTKTEQAWRTSSLDSNTPDVNEAGIVGTYTATDDDAGSRGVDVGNTTVCTEMHLVGNRPRQCPFRHNGTEWE